VSDWTVGKARSTARDHAVEHTIGLNGRAIQAVVPNGTPEKTVGPRRAVGTSVPPEKRVGLAGGEHSPPEKRVGFDGKSYPARVVSQFESSTRFNRRASLSLVCHLVDNLASVERVLGRGRSIGQRLFIDPAESHLVRTAPCLIPAQVDVMHDPI